MIPEIYIEKWRENVKWRELYQVEQDLIISRALIDLFNNKQIKNSLVFRGGTALNKIFIKPSARYSEDLDFVQKNAEPIGNTIDTIREVLNPWLGEPKRKITQRSAKLIYKYDSVNQRSSKLKIEINITEHFQVLPLRFEKYSMNSDWHSGSVEIPTYQLDELIATKLRALYQRRKGRDLFDIWYVVKNKLVNLDNVFDIFQKYCQYNKIEITSRNFIENLELKKENRDFRSDMNVLLPLRLNWNFNESYDFVMKNVINKLP
jgi:predicted nucleotidyltransferase component of viral defense system